ncbi:hypothetical protein B0H16DRAFT_1466734 [Mycena metata]|uniref:Uncharacterized protein n=1 Tax=Mycena metata TaxID=1033252 RepID=A0AAD7MWY9_9AGAR|nr:hypothetical protein B0H16DRAFT_1466734 [Mycena metata]
MTPALAALLLSALVHGEFEANASGFRYSILGGELAETCAFGADGQGTCVERQVFASSTDFATTFSGRVIPFFTLAAAPTGSTLTTPPSSPTASSSSPSSTPTSSTSGAVVKAVSSTHTSSGPVNPRGTLTSHLGYGEARAVEQKWRKEERKKEEGCGCTDSTVNVRKSTHPHPRVKTPSFGNPETKLNLGCRNARNSSDIIATCLSNSCVPMASWPTAPVKEVLDVRVHENTRECRREEEWNGTAEISSCHIWGWFEGQNGSQLREDYALAFTRLVTREYIDSGQLPSEDRERNLKTQGPELAAEVWSESALFRSSLLMRSRPKLD